MFVDDQVRILFSEEVLHENITFTQQNDNEHFEVQAADTHIFVLSLHKRMFVHDRVNGEGGGGFPLLALRQTSSLHSKLCLLVSYPQAFTA